MEQILGLVFAVLISAGVSWLDKWWKAHKRAQSRTSVPKRQQPRRNTPPPVHSRLSTMPPIIMSPENEGVSVTNLDSESENTPIMPDNNRWRQAIIDSEVLAPRNF